MRLAIIGTGYVGLVTGTCFAEMGNDVTCVDIDAEKIAKLRSGVPTLFEPGLAVYLERNIREGRLRFTERVGQAVPDAEIVFLALPTPSGEDGSADLSYVKAASASIGPLLRNYTVVVNKSTVPVGTADLVTGILRDTLTAGATYDVVSNPEFLREGVAVDDFMKPDRIVIGCSSDKARQVMERLYRPFVRSGNPIVTMDERSAEVTKYAANAFLATKISYMNEIAAVCDRVGANVDFVRLGIGSDHRIGQHFLYPGIGYGGSCFPKDVRALELIASKAGYKIEILDAVREVNERQRLMLGSRVIEHFKGSLDKKRVAVWGLSFKANTDDMREAPSLVVIQQLLEAGAEVTVFDPVATETARPYLGDTVEFASDAYDALRAANALVICTEWNEFRRPDFARMKSLMTENIIFDGRNLYDPNDMLTTEFYYQSIGRPTVDPALKNLNKIQNITWQNEH